MNLLLFSSGFKSFARYVRGKRAFCSAGISGSRRGSSRSFMCEIFCVSVQSDLIFSSKVFFVTSEYGSVGVDTRAGRSGKGSSSAS